ncbi:MAG: hypothetical protein VYA38_07070, partial [Gemmatimonadota bacterium]|nr:hypothetical protein [Gemmatimonadota bacterium]
VARSLRGVPVVAAPLLMGGGPHVDVDIARALIEPRPSSGLGCVMETLTILPPILEWPELASLTLDSLTHTRSNRGGAVQVRLPGSTYVPLRAGLPFAHSPLQSPS